ncbi:hypothetical protein [Salmonella phage SD-11_S17]|nr:hypothetical protein [Salmonella phage SD-11_S17]
MCAENINNTSGRCQQVFLSIKILMEQRKRAHRYARTYI